MLEEKCGDLDDDGSGVWDRYSQGEKERRRQGRHINLNQHRA